MTLKHTHAAHGSRAARSVLAAALALALGSAHAAAAPAGPGARPLETGARLRDLAALTPSQRRDVVRASALHGAVPAGGNHIPVTNCADSGEGSLRAAIESAVSGDTVEAIGLACGTVTLTRAITIGVDDLIVDGPGPRLLDVSNGAKYGRVFTHTGIGTLQLLGMTISSGVVSPLSNEADTRGGCVFSAGSVALGNIFDPANASQGVVVRDCTAVSTQASVEAQGGGVFATDGLTLVSSIVSGCRAAAQDAATKATGGGVTLASGTPFAMKYSEVRDNSATGTTTLSGGIDAPFASDITISHSTIAGNSAGNRAGGAYLGTANGHDVNIDNSTVSGNFANGESGLVINTQSFSPPGTIHVASTTITANTSSGYHNGAFLAGPTAIEASIFSGNAGGDLHLSGSTTTGADNIVGQYSGALPQSGLILTDDPGLAPLAANGGPTRTHALRDDSPAIDAGNNAVTSQTDQRGYARTLGARTDIGAFEFDPDRIFANGFDD